MEQKDLRNEEGLVLLIDKPRGWTSFDVVNKVRGNSPFKKVGHAGTLDPLATGLLILCLGKKTKSINDFMGLDKEYEGVFVLGKTTPSFDLETDFDHTFPIDHISPETIQDAAVDFLGEQEQEPPLFSAVKVKGQRAYDLARRGETTRLNKKKINIRELELEPGGFPDIRFRILCSKGTYIRSLARDLGQKLDSGAYLGELRRTKIGDYRVEDALSVDQAVKFLKDGHP